MVWWAGEVVVVVGADLVFSASSVESLGFLEREDAVSLSRLASVAVRLFVLEVESAVAGIVVVVADGPGFELEVGEEEDIAGSL